MCLAALLASTLHAANGDLLTVGAGGGIVPVVVGGAGTSLHGSVSGVASFQTDVIGAAFAQTENATVTNPTAETTLLGTLTGSASLGANYFTLGKTAVFIASGTYSTDIAVPGNALIRWKIGSATIAATANTALQANASDDLWSARCEVTCVATGANGRLQVAAWFAPNSSASATGRWQAISTGQVAFDTTASSSTVDLTIDTDTSDTDNVFVSKIATFGPFDGGALATSAGYGGYVNRRMVYTTANTVTLSADSVTMTNGLALKDFTTISVVVDITTASPPVANGPDAASLDTASVFRHCWYIGKDDGTKAGLISASYASTGPTALPSGYSWWAYAGPIRNNASSNFVVFSQYGKRGSFLSTIVLSGGTATSYTDLDISAVVPPTAHIACGLPQLEGQSTSNYFYIRQSAAIDNEQVVFNSQATTTAYGGAYAEWPVNDAGVCQYRLLGTTASAYLNVQGYELDK